DEVLSGVSIAFMQVPESVAFAFVAGISPVKGLYSTFFIGLIAGIFGSLPGMVSGIAGGMVNIQKELTADDGPLGDRCLSERTEWLFATTLLCGLIQLVLGTLGVTRFLKLVPHSVMAGFMNGLAIVVFRAQLNAFQTDSSSRNPKENIEIINGKVCPPMDFIPPNDQRWLRLDEGQTWQVLIIVFLSMAVVFLQPRIKRRLCIGKFSVGANVLPASLTAMVIGTVIARFIYDSALNRPIRTIGDMATFSGNVPKAHIPDVPWRSGHFWEIVIPKAVLLAIVGLVETAMTWQLCLKIVGANLPAYYCNYDCLGQGAGNLLSSFFTSVGGSVMVGQTTVNLTNGSRSRVSTTVASFLILLFVAVAGKVIEMIPVSALTGILFVVVIKTFEWRTFVYIFRWSIPVTDMITIILVTVLAVATDLAIAVLIGIAWSAVVLAWKLSNNTGIVMKVEPIKASAGGHAAELTPTDEQVEGADDGDGTKAPTPVAPQSATSIEIHIEKMQTSISPAPCLMASVKITGALFFGSTTQVMTFFEDHSVVAQLSLCAAVILDMSESAMYDSSGVEALKTVLRDISVDKGLDLFIIGLDRISLGLVTKSHKLAQIVAHGSPGTYEAIHVDGKDLVERHRSISMSA
ncbi:hypothetical protein EC988_000478, partial [Linderina pennispora]